MALNMLFPFILGIIDRFMGQISIALREEVYMKYQDLSQHEG